MKNHSRWQNSKGWSRKKKLWKNLCKNFEKQPERADIKKEH